MAIKFKDGFDHYDTANARAPIKWDSVGGQCGILASSPNPRRVGTKFFYIQTAVLADSAYVNLTAFGPTVICGFAFRRNSGGTGNQRVLFKDGNDVTCIRVDFTDTGRVRMRCGAIDVQSATNLIKINAWQHIEFKVLLHDSTGTYEVRLEQVDILSDTGVDTRSGLATLSQFMIEAGTYSGALYFDDLFICDGSGGVNDDFRGDCRVDTLMPDGAGTYTDFTPSAGANWQNVDDDGVIDNDTTYNESKTVGHQDTYNMEALSALGTTIYGVAANSCGRKTDAGPKGFKQLTIAGGTEDLGDEVLVTSDYKVYQKVMDVNPDDSAAWAEADVNAVESGVELTT